MFIVREHLVRGLAAASLLLLVSCGSESTAPVTPGAAGNVIVSGRGVRTIWSTISQVNGLGGYLIGDMTVTSDGYLHTIYSYGLGSVNGAPGSFTNSRNKINIASGDTISTAGFPSTLRAVNVGTYTVGCTTFGLVPYTDVLAYSTLFSVEGTPNFASIPFGTAGGGFSKVYGSRDVACFSNYVNPFDGLPYVIAEVSNKGVTPTLGAKVIGSTTLTASVELTTAGVPLTFVIGRNDSVSVYNHATATRLASARVPMIAQYIPANVLPSYRPSVFMVTKRNRAGTKVAGLIYNASAKVCSTFVYDIASNTFTIKVQNVALDTNLFLTGNETFDDEGNVYYASRFSPTQINRITPSGGDEVYRANFIDGATSGQVAFLKHVDTRLFAAIVVPGSSQFSDIRGKGKLVFTVVE